MSEYLTPKHKQEINNIAQKKLPKPRVEYIIPANGINSHFSSLPESTFHNVRVQYKRNKQPPVLQKIPRPAFESNTYLNNPAAYSTQLGPNAQNALAQNLPNSTILNASLIRDAQIPDPNSNASVRTYGYKIEYQTHHIVETSNIFGQIFLLNANIDLNAPINGVLLPKYAADDTGDATVHNGSHVLEYRYCVNIALQNAIQGLIPHTPLYTQAVVNTLATIRDILLSQNVPINQRVDGDYDPNTNNEISIRAIFRNWGLL